MKHEITKLALVRAGGSGFVCGQNGEPTLYPLRAQNRLEKAYASSRIVRVRVTTETVDSNGDPFPACTIRGCQEQATAYYGTIGYCGNHDPHANENLTHESRRGRR